MSNTARRTAITYPDGRVVTLGYGASRSIEDAFSLVKTVAIEGESGDKVDYTRVGLGRFVTIAYPQPGVEMSMIRPDGGSEGDSGDPYDGFDCPPASRNDLRHDCASLRRIACAIAPMQCFSRVQEMRWQDISSGTPIDAWKWGYNEASTRTWKKNLVAAGGQDEAYAYDGLSQVIRDAVGTLNTNRTAIGGIPGEEEGFTYDPTGNWLAYRKEANGSSVLDQSRSNNKDNQLKQIDGSSQGIEFDRAGNATKLLPGAGGDWSKEFIPVWDAWNRLVEVKDENGATVQKNTYDGLSRRITSESGGKVVHTYWSDRWKPLEERMDSATTAARQYLWGERPGHRDELVLRDRDTNGDGTLDERLYAMMDYFNGTSILDTSGNVLERYAYGAFGPRRVMAPDFTSRGASLYDWDFGFQGQLRDGETGWYNYGYRFYVPELGRWINRDPIGERGGENLYAFLSNRVPNAADRLGLSGWRLGNSFNIMRGAKCCVNACKKWTLSGLSCLSGGYYGGGVWCYGTLAADASCEFNDGRGGRASYQFWGAGLTWGSAVGLSLIEDIEFETSCKSLIEHEGFGRVTIAGAAAVVGFGIAYITTPLTYYEGSIEFGIAGAGWGGATFFGEWSIP